MSDRRVFERVVDCVERTTRYPRSLLTPTANLADELGIDSVKQVEIVVAIEEAFGVRIDRRQASRVKTIAEIAQLLASTLEAAPPPEVPARTSNDVPRHAARAPLTRAEPVPAREAKSRRDASFPSTGADVLERVVACIERTTRYPRSLLTPTANLADELGIDSVKQVEIVVSLEETFGLRLDRRQAAGVKTIADIAQFVGAALTAAADATAPALREAAAGPLARPTLQGIEPPAQRSLGAPPNTENVLERVVDCIERTTRYPRSLLTPTANLADELGIDSVKQVEIVVALEEAFGIRLERKQASRVRTIADVAQFVLLSLEARGSTGETAAPAESAAPQGEAGARAATRVAAPRRSDVLLRDPSGPRTDAIPPPPPPAPGGRDAGASEAWSGNVVRPLEGRIALVTGSGRSTGRTIAELLAARGATVVINSFHSREMGEQTAADIRQRGGRAVHVWGSVAQPDHVSRMFDEIERLVGGLDILVCNASDGRIGSFLDLTPEDWDRAFRTNIVGHHACAVRAAPLMAARGGGSIITMSTAGAHHHVRGLGCQGVVKAALETMTRYLACEFAPLRIRANCVAVGPVYSAILDRLAEDPAVREHWEAMTPGGALTSPIEVARAIAFLASDDSAAINGAVWAVDRGFSAHMDGELATMDLEALLKGGRAA